MDEKSGGLEESRAWAGRHGLARAQDDKVIAGVCAGIARRFDMPVLIVRVLMVAAAVVGPGILVYPILWILMPRADDPSHA